MAKWIQSEHQTRNSSNSSCAASHCMANWMMDSALTFSRNEVLRWRILGKLFARSGSKQTGQGPINFRSDWDLTLALWNQHQFQSMTTRLSIAARMIAYVWSTNWEAGFKTLECRCFAKQRLRVLQCFLVSSFTWTVCFIFIAGLNKEHSKIKS